MKIELIHLRIDEQEEFEERSNYQLLSMKQSGNKIGKLMKSN